jgi:putative oxidoreductase
MHATWFLRIPFAATFFYHGAGKLLVPQLSAELHGLPLWLTLLVGVAEILVAAGVLAGGTHLPRADLGNRLGALGALPILLGAIAVEHWPKWSFVASESHPLGGMEFQVALLGIALFLLMDRRRD